MKRDTGCVGWEFTNVGYHSLSGWLLSTFVHLDGDCPGVLGHAIKAGGFWRNAVALAFATGVLDQPEHFMLRATGELSQAGAESSLSQLARLIQTMTPHEIVNAAVPVVPTSLMGSLKKIGREPFRTPDAYRRLVALLKSTSADGRARRRVLEQTNGCSLTDDPVLQTIEILDLAILSPTVVSQISSADEARRLNARLRVIRRMCSTATDDALKASAAAMGSRFNAGRFARAWLAKADRLPPTGAPIDGAPDFVRVNPSTAVATGRRYRNCLAGYAHEMAAGASAFFSIESLSVIVCLRLTDVGWLLAGVHLYGNAPLSRQVVEEVKGRLTQVGVVCILPIRPPGHDTGLTGVFSRVDDLDFLENVDVAD